jgi:hypothetical protein
MDLSICAGYAGGALTHVNLARLGSGSLAVKEEGWRAGTAGDDAVEAGWRKCRVIFLLAPIQLGPLGGTEEESAKCFGSAALHWGQQQEQQQKKRSCRVHLHIGTNLA